MHLDPKKQLSIAELIAKSDGAELDFKPLIEPEYQSSSKIYALLNQFRCPYVTTNYDDYLDARLNIAPSKIRTNGDDSLGAFRTPLICRPEQFKTTALDEDNCVIHLHGSVTDPSSFVFTTHQYLEHYSDERVISFLTDLFQHYVVLFVGYGLEETEILEYVFRRGISTHSSERSIFYLHGFFDHQQKTFDHLYYFYEQSFGVYIIHFILDHLEYRQLEKIVEDWTSRIEIGDRLLADELAIMLKAADE